MDPILYFLPCFLGSILWTRQTNELLLRLQSLKREENGGDTKLLSMVTHVHARTRAHLDVEWRGGAEESDTAPESSAAAVVSGIFRHSEYQHLESGGLQAGGGARLQRPDICQNRVLMVLFALPIKAANKEALPAAASDGASLPPATSRLVPLNRNRTGARLHAAG